MASETYTPDLARSLEGPEWLRERRAAAAVAAGSIDAPTSELEEWRYSRIGDLRFDRYTLADASTAPGTVPVPAAALIATLGELAGIVVVHNGRIVDAQLGEAATSAGVHFGAATDDSDGVLGATGTEPNDLFVAYNDAFSSDPVLLRVPRGRSIEHPFAVVNYVDADGSLTFPRLSIQAGEDSEFGVLEASLSADVDALVVPVTEVSVASAARVRHSGLQDLGPRVWQLGSLVGDVGQSATFSSGVAALGGSYARLRLDCHLSGRGATGNLAAVYFGDGEQMLDLRTFQEHRAADTTSNLLFKGAVADRSHSVYTGLIRIQPEGRGTNAFQTNRNLKLSDDAWAESVPNLEIENNDVHCSHASTVGPVDEDQRFYLESRGVPRTAADRLIVAGFFDEVLDALPVPELAPAIRDRIAELLDQQVRTGALGAEPDTEPAASGAEPIVGAR